jgi:hypothetical protein
MNVRKGVFRLYIVATVCWVVLFILLALNETTQNAGLVATAIIVPAVGYVLLFLIIPWIWRGFRSK